MNRSKKDHILNVASDLFNKQGIRATCVDQVIAESQITKITWFNDPEFNRCAFIKVASSEFTDVSHPYHKAAQKYKASLKIS